MTEERWRSVALKDIATDDKYGVVGGPFGSKLVSRDYVPEGVPVLRGTNLPLDREIALDDLVFVTDEKVEKDLFGNLAHPGDIVVTQRGTLGQIGLLPDAAESPYDRYVVSQSQMKLTVDPEKANNRFVYYALRSPGSVKRIQDLGMSSGVPHINLDIFRNFEIRLPDLPVQRAIADWLRSFDDLIENNRRRIEILEEMARLIYREWFVHFRFPGHEEVELVGSDLGPIPEGWDVQVTSDLIAADILEIGDGYRAKNSEFAGAGFAFVRVKNVREGYLDLNDVDYLPESYGERVGGKRARPGDCVICMKGTVGRMAFVGERTPPLIYSPQVSYWRSLQPHQIAPEYLRLWMQSPVFVEQCARVKGATDMADYVNLRDQRAMRLAVPSPAVHAAFVACVSPLLSLSDNLRSQIEVLTEARDLLLPRLISGELDVSGLDLDLEPVA